MNYDKMRRYTSQLRGILNEDRKSLPTHFRLGCTVDGFIEHMNNSFIKRYGNRPMVLSELEINHLIPLKCSNIDLEDDYQVSLLTHYSNYQLITKSENTKKNNNLELIEYATDEMIHFITDHGIGKPSSFNNLISVPEEPVYKKPYRDEGADYIIAQMMQDAFEDYY